MEASAQSYPISTCSIFVALLNPELLERDRYKIVVSTSTLEDTQTGVPHRDSHPSLRGLFTASAEFENQLFTTYSHNHGDQLVVSYYDTTALKCAKIFSCSIQTPPVFFTVSLKAKETGGFRLEELRQLDTRKEYLAEAARIITLINTTDSI